MKQATASTLMLVLVTSTASAQPRNPFGSLPTLVAEDADETVSLKCHGASPYDTVTCTIIRSRVYRKLERSVQREFDAARASIPSDRASEAEWRRNFDNGCKELKKLSSSGNNHEGPLKRIATEQHLKMFGEVCAAKTIPGVEKVLLRHAEDSRQDCTIDNYVFTRAFVRDGEHRWKSVDRSGVCDEIDTLILDGDAFVWSYTEHRTVNNPDASCAENHGGTRRFTTGHLEFAGCRFIEFGITVEEGGGGMLRP